MQNIFDTIGLTFLAAAVYALWAITPANAETLIETRAGTAACKRAQEAMAAAYREKAPDSILERLERKYECACGTIYPSTGPTAKGCRK